MIYLVDTNVLLRFVDRRSAQHARVRNAVRKLRRAGHGLAIAPQNCVEFWNVATRPADKNGLGLKPTDADRLLRLVERLFPLLPEGPQVYAEWRKLVVHFGVAGVQVHDARLVAAMIEQGVTHILTLNTGDFHRYAHAGIVPVDPAVV